MSVFPSFTFLTQYPLLLFIRTGLGIFSLLNFRCLYVIASLEGSIHLQTPTKDKSAYGVRSRGKAGQFLESKGFGWLLEEEDMDEEDLEPLL